MIEAPWNSGTSAPRKVLDGAALRALGRQSRTVATDADYARPVPNPSHCEPGAKPRERTLLIPLA